MSNSVIVLAIDADWDLVTTYGFAFRNHFVFSRFSTDWPLYQLHHLCGPQATQSSVGNCLSNHPIDYISGMGHGAYDAFTGYQNGLIWNTSLSLSSLKGTIVHLLSCQTAALLGREMVREGVRAFWGYTVNFTFFHSSIPPQDLTKDKTAEVFLKMDCIIDRGILSNKSAADIYDSVESYFAQVYSQLSTAHRAVLLDNFVHLVCPVINWGDPAAALEDGRSDAVEVEEG